MTGVVSITVLRNVRIQPSLFGATFFANGISATLTAGDSLDGGAVKGPRGKNPKSAPYREPSRKTIIGEVAQRDVRPKRPRGVCLMGWQHHGNGDEPDHYGSAQNRQLKFGKHFRSTHHSRTTVLSMRCAMRCALLAQADQVACHLLDVAQLAALTPCREQDGWPVLELG
jgi:hypothetical protein